MKLVLKNSMEAGLSSLVNEVGVGPKLFTQVHQYNGLDSFFTPGDPEAVGGRETLSLSLSLSLSSKLLLFFLLLILVSGYFAYAIFFKLLLFLFSLLIISMLTLLFILQIYSCLKKKKIFMSSCPRLRAHAQVMKPLKLKILFIT